MANFGLHVAYPLPDHVVEARRRAAARRGTTPVLRWLRAYLTRITRRDATRDVARATPPNASAPASAPRP
jgi:hypothetical protein